MLSVLFLNLSGRCFSFGSVFYFFYNIREKLGYRLHRRWSSAVVYGETCVDATAWQPLRIGRKLATLGEVDEVCNSKIDESLKFSSSKGVIRCSRVFSRIDSFVDFIGIAYGSIDCRWPF